MPVHDFGVRDIGDDVELRVTFTDSAGGVANPTTVTLAERTPAGVETAVTTGFSNPAVGIYTHRVVGSTEGEWAWEIRGTGASYSQIHRFLVIFGPKQILTV